MSPTPEQLERMVAHVENCRQIREENEIIEEEEKEEKYVSTWKENF